MTTYPINRQTVSIKAFRLSHLSLLTIFALLASACGGGGSGGGGSGGGGTSPPPPTTTPPPPPAAGALVPSGTPALFVRSAFRAPDGNDTIFETVHLIVPGTGEVTALSTNSSTSGARSFLKQFTFDDRLVLLRNTGATAGGSADWREVDVAAPTRKSDGQLDDPLPVAASAFTNAGNLASNCVALVGNDLFWKSPEFAGGLRSVRLGTGGRVDGNLLIPSTDGEHCFGRNESADGAPGAATEVGGMTFADGTWHAVDFDADSGQMTFYQRDVVSGRPTEVATYTPTDHALYNRAYSFSFDNGMAYWTRVHSGNQQIELWRYELVGEPVNLFAGAAVGVTVNVVSQLDVDDGRASFVVGSDFSESNNVAVVDTTTSDAFLVNLLDFVPPVGGQIGPTFSDLEIMVR